MFHMNQIPRRGKLIFKFWHESGEWVSAVISNGKIVPLLKDKYHPINIVKMEKELWMKQ